VRGPLSEDAEGHFGGFGVIQFSERVDQENVENVSCTSRCRRSRAGVKLLGNLIGEAQAANGRCHGDSQFGETPDVGINEVHRARFCRSEIDHNGLPGSGPILSGNFDTNRVGMFHIPGSRFDSKCEIVESQLQDGR